MSAGADDAVVVSHLRVVKGRRVVLDDLSCRVEAGSVTGLLGPSGSGKTTLFRAIVGVQAIGAGAVTVLGAPAGAPALRRTVGYMTQAASVYPDLTVAENLTYFARVLDAGPDRIDHALDDVDLRPHRDQLVRDLSGGERARVSLAIALLNEPALLVLDEPTVGLDPVLRRDLWALFHRLAAAGTTLLVSSHVMDEAGQCEALLLLREGQLLYEGTPADLLARAGGDDLDEAFVALVEDRS